MYGKYLDFEVYRNIMKLFRSALKHSNLMPNIYLSICDIVWNSFLNCIQAFVILFLNCIGSSQYFFFVDQSILRLHWGLFMQTFCLEHRSYKEHNCPKEGMKDITVAICPVCATSVRMVYGETMDLTLARHMQDSSCDPKNYDKVMKKPKCPVKRCREVLTTTNTYMCKTCKMKVCLKHRFPADHLCTKGAKTRAESLDALTKNFMSILSHRKGTDCAVSSSKIGSKLGASTSSRNLNVH